LEDDAFVAASMRERYRDWYLAERDPIPGDRLRWRAQVFRQIVHLLPGQRILEIGAGQGAFTRELAAVSRGENPVSTMRFEENEPGALEREYPLVAAVVSYDILDARNASQILTLAFDSLEPGGQAVFFATNPGNPVLKARRTVSRITRNKDPRQLLDRSQIEHALAGAGFEGIFSLFTDFLYAPLTKKGARRFHDLSAIMQNAPGIRTFSGAMVAYGRKPGKSNEPVPAITEHASLHGRISVVVPCHNEEMNIGLLVDRLRALYDAYITEIILVDDNSVDGTAGAMKRLAESDPRVRLISRRPPAGAGRALADGYRAATGDYILSLDADFQHLLPEVRDLFDAIADGADAAVGSRFSPDSVLLNYPVTKIIANRGFHLLASLALRRSFRDLTNNLKLMRREIAQKLKLDQPGFALNAETGMGPLMLGYRVDEVPISWVGRDEQMGASSFRLAAAGPGYLKVLRRLRRMKATR
jgi:hypothetical protein